MPDLKISQLIDGGLTQATDEFVVARAGTNNKITGANLATAATATINPSATQSGSALVNQADIGSAPNEVPLNQYLGTMAFQDANAVNVASAQVTGNITFAGTQVGNVISTQTTPVSVSTSATTILSAAGSIGRLVVVNGISGSDRFCDLVFSSTTVSPSVVSSFTAQGSPAARTYSRSGQSLELAMASGTYDVRAIAIGF